MKIAHLSDLHVRDFAGLRPWHLLNKRVLGGLNLLTHRSRVHQTEVAQEALRHVARLKVDHTLISGDMSNLALESEFEAGSALLRQEAGDPHDVSLVPGNHDYYTYSAARQRRFEAHFEPWQRSDLPHLAADGHYPYVRLRGPVAVVGVNSCVPSAPMLAIGRVGQAQREALAEALRHPEVQRRFVLVMLHHHLEPPPVTKPRKELTRELRDHRAVLEVLRDGGADLVVHGHNHQHSLRRYTRPGRAGQMVICEAGSTSVAHFREARFGGKFNVYELREGVGDGPATLARVTTWLYKPEEGQFSVWQQEDLAPPQAAP